MLWQRKTAPGLSFSCLDWFQPQYNYFDKSPPSYQPPLSVCSTKYLTSLSKKWQWAGILYRPASQPIHIMTYYAAALPNWLHLVPLQQNVIGLLLMREFWEDLNEGAPGGKVTHSQVFFQAANNWDISAGRAKQWFFLLLRLLFERDHASDDTSDIQECFTALTSKHLKGRSSVCRPYVCASYIAS